MHVSQKCAAIVGDMHQNKGLSACPESSSATRFGLPQPLSMNAYTFRSSGVSHRGGLAQPLRIESRIAGMDRGFEGIDQGFCRSACKVGFCVPGLDGPGAVVNFFELPDLLGSQRPTHNLPGHTVSPSALERQAYRRGCLSALPSAPAREKTRQSWQRPVITCKTNAPGLGSQFLATFGKHLFAPSAQKADPSENRVYMVTKTPGIRPG